MKRKFFYIVFTLILLQLVSIPFLSLAQRPSDLLSIQEAESKSARRRFELQSNGSLKTLASTNFDIHHLTCNWKVDPTILYINGGVRVDFTIISGTDNIIFDLIDQLQVDSVLYHSNKIDFARSGNQTLQVKFPAALSTGAKDSVTIFYQGVPASGSGFGSFVTGTHAGVPVCWTLSEPYGSRDWWPCKNGLDDKADSIDVYITTPEAYTGISIGNLQETLVNDGEKTTHWKHSYPVASYLIALAATNYITTVDTVQLGQKILPMVQNVYPESANSFRLSLRFSRRTLRIFHETFGDYPFINEKYGHTQFSWGGGMENQTNSFMTNASEALVVHEAAHQWFGDKITCGSWQDIWLNEGFAGFLTNYTTEKFYSLSLYRTILREQLSSIVSVPGGSVFVPDTTDVGRIFDGRLTYTKGTWVLHMLRWKMGDAAFFKGMRNYLKDSKFAYGFAFTKDFVKHMEQVSGISLTEFFEDWFYGEGYPTYHLGWNNMGGGWVQTDLSQSTSHNSVDFFEMPVAIRFKNATEDTIVVIDHSKNNQRSYLQLGFIPDSAFIDPEIKLISANNTVQKFPDDADKTSTVITYPNPVQDDLNILLKHFEAGKYSMVLYSNTGQRIWFSNSQDISGFQVFKLPMGNLPRGIYILRITGDNGFKQSRKILR